MGATDWKSVVQGDQNANTLQRLKQPLHPAIDKRRLAMYLESVITHMLRGTAKTEELLPDRWKAAHPEAVREFREQERSGTRTRWLFELLRCRSLIEAVRGNLQTNVPNCYAGSLRVRVRSVCKVVGK
jgi:hypothetical protein